MMNIHITIGVFVMDDYDKLKKDTKQKAEDLYQEGKNKASGAYNDVKHRTESMAHTVKDTASDLYAEGRKKISHLNDCVGEYGDEFVKTVRNKPLTSLLIAGAVGFLLSAISKR